MKSSASDPPFLGELAHFEWMELELSIAKDESVEKSIETDGSLLDRPAVFAPTLQLLRYSYPVQCVVPGQNGWRKWKAWRRRPIELMTEATFMLGFRDQADEVRFIEINAATVRLFELLAGNEMSGRQALLQLAAELKANDPETIIAFELNVMSELQKQGAILGTQPCL